MLVALATPCQEEQACWRSLPWPDDFPFVSPDVAVAWATLYLVCLVLLLRRLRRR